MSTGNMATLKVRVFVFGAESVADVLIRIVNAKSVVGIYRSNPISVDLPAGNYALYISGEAYDTALRGFNLLPGQELRLELPAYPVGTMPRPPATVREAPVVSGGVDFKALEGILGAEVKESAVVEKTDDGPAYVDYRNRDGFVFTTKFDLRNERALSTVVGSVPIVVLALCGNNTWREIGSPR